MSKITKKESIRNSLSYQEYKGYQLLSFEGSYIWILVGPLIYVALFKSINPVMPNFSIFVLIILAWTALCSLLLHYFRVSENHLIVKAHNLFWKKHVYTISEVREVVFEEPTSYRFRTKGLRIITKDFKTKLYPAGSLTTKTWLQLKADLEKKGIRVRNEYLNR